MGKNSNNKLGIICVLFERQFEEIGIYSIFKVLKKKFDIIIFDNSNSPKKELINKDYYYCLKFNVGKSVGYSKSLLKLEKRGCSHVMFLDQDTIINEFFFDKIIINISNSPEAVLVPRVETDEGIISPCQYHWWYGINKLNSKFIFNSYFISAISSGSVHPVKIIKKHIPFPKIFWLDYFDHWLFQLSQK